MTLREFILNESCNKNGRCEGEFDAAKDFEEKEAEGGAFEFVAKIKVDGADESEAKKKLEDALADFDAKIKVKKAEKKEGEEVDESVVEEGIAGSVILGLLGFAVIKNVIAPMIAKGFVKFARNFSIKANEAPIKGMAQRIFDLYDKNTGMSRSDFKKLVLNDHLIKKHADTIAKRNGDNPLEADQVVEMALNALFKAEDEVKKEQAAKKFSGKKVIRRVPEIQRDEEVCPECGRDFKHCSCR